MIRLFALCVLVLPALAQQEGQLSLGGTVINTKTGEPVRRALVRITHFGEPGEQFRQAGGREVQAPVTRTAFTDSSGEFHFAALPPGRYTVGAQKPGYAFGATAGKANPFTTVDLSASNEDVRVNLSPLGVVIGKIVDQDGLPQIGVNVIALRTQIQDGLRQIRSDRSVSTDDRGIYRLWDLAPGKYYIKAAGFGGGTRLVVGSSSGFTGDESFAPVYFGGGKTLDAAAAVEIGPGTEAQANFALTSEPAFKIRGTVRNLVPRRTAKFELLSGADDVSAIRATVNNDTGRFELEAVVSGSYVLRATQDGNTAETPVAVRSTDVDGVSLALMPPVDIPVVTRFAGRAPARPADDDDSVSEGCITQIRPAGRLFDPLYSFGKMAEKSGAGTVIRGVSPGKYRVSIQCFGGYAHSAMAGTHDLAADPILTVEPGATPPAIEIAASRGGGSIKGKLAVDVPSGPTILLVPQFSSVAGPQVGTAFPAQGQRTFQFNGLAPGSYIAWAFTNPEIEYRNPEFLRTLSGGVVVQIEGDGEKEVTIDGVVQ